VELTHPDLNPRFDMRAIFITNYFSLGGDVPINSEPLLVTDFVNLKIKSTQFFRDAHRGRTCPCVYRD
jgi:hypothetical protein